MHALRVVFLTGLLGVVGCGGGGSSLRSAAAGHGAATWDDAALPLELPAGPPPVTPGERMTYRLSVFDVEIGAYVITVAPPAPLVGRTAIAVQSGAQSTGIGAALKRVKADLAVWIDASTGRPLLLRIEEVAGGGDDTIETTEARFSEGSGGTYPVWTQRPDAGEVTEVQTAIGTPMDITTVLMMLRGWEGPVGERRVFDVLRSRYQWRTQLVRAGKDHVVTALGELPAVRFEAITRRYDRKNQPVPGAPERHFAVWISDDADRVPILCVAESDYGNLRMELQAYDVGR